MTFPHLAPVCAAAKGDALLLLTRHADVFAERLPRDPGTRVLLPLLARAADEGLPLCIFLCVVHTSTSCPWNATMHASALQPSGIWQVFVYLPGAGSQSLCAGRSPTSLSTHAERCRWAAGEPRCQEEMLKRVPKVAERSDLSVVESEIVPRINQLCLATTNAGVRVAALSALAALASRLPKDHALRSLSTIAKVAELDHGKAVLAALDSSHEKCVGVGLK